MKAGYILKTVPLVLAAGLLATTAARAQAPAAAPPPPPSVKTGQAAPDFSANYLTMGENGRPQFKTTKLSDYKGQKNVVLAFFPAAFSPGCTNEMAKYEDKPGDAEKAMNEWQKGLDKATSDAKKTP